MKISVLCISAAVAALPLFVLPSCCPCRRIAGSTADSMRVETRVHREVVRDTVAVVLPRESERVTVRDTVSRLETSLAVSEARINRDGSLSHSLANRATVLPVTVDRVTVVRDSIVWRDRVQTRTVEVQRQLTRWQRVRLHGFWVLLGVTILLVRLFVGKLFI